MLKIFPKYLNFENISKKCIRVRGPLHFLLWRKVKEEQFFMDFLLGNGFREKYKHTELALNFIQKPFSFYYSRIATPWISKKLFIKFSFLKGTLRR